MPATDLANAWFARRGWKPFAFQRRVWAAVARGESGLLHASTGAGKTYAVWLAALRAFKTQPQGSQPVPLQVVWVTPMRALAADTARALPVPVDEPALPWGVGVRIGDTGCAGRARAPASGAGSTGRPSGGRPARPHRAPGPSADIASPGRGT